MTDLTNTYAALGVAGLIIVVALFLLIWWLTKGRKESETSKQRLTEEYARTGVIIQNNTEALKAVTSAFEAFTIEKQSDADYHKRMDERITRQGDQLDELLQNQKVCMALQKTKQG
jgi:heme A synthase